MENPFAPEYHRPMIGLLATQHGKAERAASNE